MKDYWDDLPVDLVNAAMMMVDLMEDQGTLSADYSDNTSHGDIDRSYLVRARNTGFVLKGPGDVLLSLDVLGLIVRDKARMSEGEGTFSLTPEALAFAHYKRKNRFERWWQRTIVANAAAIGAVTTGAIALVLAIVQIMQALQTWKLIP